MNKLVIKTCHRASSVPLKRLGLLHVQLVWAFLVVLVCRLLKLLLGHLLRTWCHLIALVRGLVIQSTFRLNPVDGALVAHHTVALLLIGRYRWIWAWFVHTAIRNNALHFHHCVEFLACLLELLLVPRVVRIWTYCTHCVRARFLAHHIVQTAHYSGLVFDFYVDWIVRVDRTTVWHWTLGTGTSLHASLAWYSAHLASRLKNLLTSTSTSVHCVVHHARLVKLTVCLPVKGIVVLLILTINTLWATRPLKMLTLSSISIARLLVGDNTATNHT